MHLGSYVKFADDLRAGKEYAKKIYKYMLIYEDGSQVNIGTQEKFLDAVNKMDIEINKNTDNLPLVDFKDEIKFDKPIPIHLTEEQKKQMISVKATPQ